MEKAALPLSKKILYGLGDSAWCFISLLISSFLMIYLTDTAGLNAGIIGTLMLVARLLDGVSDAIFGLILDKTHTKMGKARPWLFGSMFGCALCLVASFAVPESLGAVAKYVWFFVFYLLLNSVFFTSGYISYGTLLSLITHNQAERVQLASYRTISGNVAYMVLGVVTFSLVTVFGGGAAGWRTLGIVYAIVGIIINSIVALSLKELPEEEEEKKLEFACCTNSGNGEIVRGKRLKTVLSCRYFYFITLLMIVLCISLSVFTTSAAYYATYVLKNENMMATISVVTYGVTVLVALLIPFVSKKMDVQKMCIYSLVIGLVGRFIALSGGSNGTIVVIFLGLGISTVGSAVIQTAVNTMSASVSLYLHHKDGVHANGIVFAGTSVGTKLGHGFGTALSGILLDIGGYIGNAAIQPVSAIKMIDFMFLWIPIIAVIAMIILCAFTDVDKKLKQMQESNQPRCIDADYDP